MKQFSKFLSIFLFFAFVLTFSQTKREGGLSQWVEKNLNLKIPRNKLGLVNSLNINIKNDLPKKLKSELENEYYWLGERKISSMIVKHPNYLEMDLSEEEEYTRTLFLNQRYLVLTHHAIGTAYDNTILIDLENMQSVTLEALFVESFINSDVLKVSKEYFDNGHVWETGKYFIKTKKYIMTSKER